jgi:hypothetical protein
MFELYRARTNRDSIYLLLINVKYSWETEWFGHTSICYQEENEEIEERIVRFRTVGDMSCTAAVDSYAATISSGRRN